MSTEEKIAICLTFKNRAEYLKAWFESLMLQSINLKTVQVCIADGGSTDCWKSVVENWVSDFHSIKTAFCDREELPFKVASNCPATDRNALCVNMPDCEKIIVTDPEVIMTHPNTLSNIVEQLNFTEHMICHTCHRTPKEITPERWREAKVEGRGVHMGGFMHAFNKSEFIRNGGYDERYSLGFAGEDSYFFWWWRKNRKVIPGTFPVIHLWHPSPSARASYKELRRTYTMPLYDRLKKENSYPNSHLENDTDWHRPETIKGVALWKV